MKNDLKDRPQKFGINCWFLCNKFPISRGFNAYVNQLIRCSSSVGANYRASQRAKSTADFIYKLKIVEEEVDESGFFLEMLIAISNEEYQDELKDLHKESTEILAIIVASINTARKNRK